MPNAAIVKTPIIQPTDVSAEEIVQHQQHATYLIEKLLNNLDGKSEEIVEDLIGLLKNPDTTVSNVRRLQFKHIQYLLKDVCMKSIVQRVIKNKISEIVKYRIEQAINELPGKYSEIKCELNALLLNPDAAVSLDRQFYIIPIRAALKDTLIGPMTIEVIKLKINAINNPSIEKLPNDIRKLLMFSYLTSQNRMAMSRINKQWHLCAQDMNNNRLMLEEEFGLDPEDTIKLKSPYKVHMKLKKLKMNHIVYKRALRLVPISILSFILDSCTIHEKVEFFTSIRFNYPLSKDRYERLPLYSLLHIALLIGDVELSQYLIDYYGLKITNNIHCVNSSQLCISALLSGNLSLVIFILSSSQIIPHDKYLFAAIDSRCLQLVEYLFNHFEFKSNDILQTKLRAVRTGNIQLVQYIFNKYPINKSDILTFRTAESAYYYYKDNLELMQLDQKFPHVKENILLLKAAMESGNSKLMIFLQNYYGVHLILYPSDHADDFFIGVGKCDNYEMTNYLFDNFKRNAWMSEKSEKKYNLNVAARMGNLCIVKKMLDMGHPASLDLLNRAVGSGEIELVKYLIKEHRLVPNQETLRSAFSDLSHNNFVVLKYLLRKFPLTFDINLIKTFQAKEPNLSFAMYLFHQIKFPPSIDSSENKMINKMTQDFLERACQGVELEKDHTQDKMFGKKTIIDSLNKLVEFVRLITELRLRSLPDQQSITTTESLTVQPKLSY